MRRGGFLFCYALALSTRVYDEGEIFFSDPLAFGHCTFCRLVGTIGFFEESFKLPVCIRIIHPGIVVRGLHSSLNYNILL
jgi:hypothetical protein